MKVKVNGAPPKDPPKPVNKAVIDGQGSIPYATAIEEKTPDTMFAKVTTGKKRGMGAALRGSRFTSA
ncbi:hypothetical protein [Hyphomonas sp.]|uniref:hypothetical protein n=1 Tax=Hyphomonas sp. TaxID=87 RepID=UPI000C944EBD|nr:hypothetical protein [Hyphomonas sp.]MAL45938.1 hypothetical protein [Hyphomonas sp.]